MPHGAPEPVRNFLPAKVLAGEVSWEAIERIWLRKWSADLADALRRKWYEEDEVLAALFFGFTEVLAVLRAGLDLNSGDDN